MIKKIIEGKLKALTGVHIGSGVPTETTDLPIYRTAENEIVIPGTAISGALRTLATKIAPHFGLAKCLALDERPTENFCRCPVCDIFGSIILGEDAEKASASKIWVSDACLKNGNVKPAIRDGTGIDRETKSSARASRAKYDFEVLPQNSEFTFRFELRGDITEENETILAAVLSEWTHGRCYLGGGLARGTGNMQLKELKVYTLDISSPEKLITFLKEDNPITVASEEIDWLDRHVETAKNKIKTIDGGSYLYNSFARIEFELQFTGGFVINDRLRSTQAGFDFCPYMEAGEFVLPGSSLRGVLRSHAEKIARTVVTLNCTTGNEFLTSCPACNPHADNKVPLASCNSLLRKYRKKQQIPPEKEVKEEQLCLACQLFGNSYRGSRLYISDGHLKNAPQLKIMDFLAIDRFNGGGKEGAKFDALILWKPAFKVRMFFENPKEWELGWLMLVLRDMRDGLLSVGFGQNKWFGKVELKEENINVGFISADFAPKCLKISESIKDVFKTATWNFEELVNVNEPENPLELWIKDFHDALKHFSRDDNLRPTSDTYFDGTVEKLYPKEVEL
jgi:CRISPR/Cas system CSM-associated protein Csm3 (group 7 of RAMP superfamily)